MTEAVCIVAVCPHDQNDPTSLDVVLAEAQAAATDLADAVANDLPPPSYLYEHGLSAPLGPHQ